MNNVIRLKGCMYLISYSTLHTPRDSQSQHSKPSNSSAPNDLHTPPNQPKVSHKSGSSPKNNSENLTMFDMYERLLAHSVRKTLADQIDRLITVLLGHIDFFEFKESRRPVPKMAQVMTDQTQMILDALLTKECWDIMHKNEKNYLLYLEIRQIIPKVEEILDCDEVGDWKGAREAAKKCRDWIEGLQ